MLNEFENSACLHRQFTQAHPTNDYHLPSECDILLAMNPHARPPMITTCPVFITLVAVNPMSNYHLPSEWTLLAVNPTAHEHLPS